ncbi:MAG: HlyD family efflux transporter periplasmic adaptor subunit [Eubacteriales bacterium]|nr:HlyD family efflux transporter periplasmic adaptor subunit [Eubacteriales bacterium]
MKKKTGTGFNIGTVIFGAIALYIIITALIYMTSDHISTYMVTPGTLSGNERYTALAIRNETVVQATGGGYVNYYIEDGGKTSKNEIVCSIGSDAQQASASVYSNTDWIREKASAFSSEYTTDKYSSVYDFRYVIRNGASSSAKNVRNIGTPVKAPVDGVVSYTSDGMEELTIASLTAENFHPDNYSSNQLRTGQSVDAGSALYRVVNGDTWDLVLKLTERQYSTLSGRQYVKVRFDMDGCTEKGDLKLFERDGDYYADITLYSGAVRYRNQRYIDIELIITANKGLKVPLSSIVTKEFYLIPTDYYTPSTNNSDAGFLVLKENENGQKQTEKTDCDIYAKLKTDSGQEVYYVDASDFSRGDVLQKPDSNETYTITEMGSLEGVYATNKGYTQFRRAVILDQNDEYCIVQENVDYGVSQFDYIVRDGSMVYESQILYNRN